MNDTAQYTMQPGEVAQRLDVTRQTVHNLAADGVLSFIEKARGRKIWKYFNPAEVERFAQERSIKTA